MSEPLTLEYNLAELPSSQHRAGLAGLVLMVEWHKANPDKKGVCEISHLSETGATLEIDQEGLQSLFDKVYAAFNKTIETDKKPAGKNTKFTTEEREITDSETGRTKKKTYFTYTKVEPNGAFLVDYDSTFDGKDGIWIKLWRQMLWETLRGRDKQRIPYQKRANNQEDKNILELWNNLQKASNKEVKISGTNFLGIRSANAESVNFNDAARFEFLLNFWVFVAQIYVPKILKFDKKKNQLEQNDNGYALAIPDIANLEIFCEEFPQVLQQREDKLSGYRPKESVIDVAAEGALELMHKLNQTLARRINYRISDLLLGVDVFHIDKPDNDLLLLGTIRIEPIREMIDEYSRVNRDLPTRFFVVKEFLMF